MDIKTAAYAAGIFDGEGYIGVQKDLRSPVARYSLRALVKTTNEKIAMWLQENFGGTFLKDGAIKGNRKTQYGWYLNSDAAVEKFIEIVLPFLIIKKRHAYEAMNFIHREWNENGEDFYRRLKKLNSRGRNDV